MAAAHLDMDSLIAIGRELAGVTESTYFGARALKLEGRMLACTPVNKSAEADSAIVAMGFEQRAALIAKHPSLYYLTDHYAAHPTVLVRLPRMSRTDLERTLRMAWDFVSTQNAAKRPVAAKRPKVTGNRGPGPRRRGPRLHG